MITAARALDGAGNDAIGCSRRLQFLIVPTAALRRDRQLAVLHKSASVHKVGKVLPGGPVALGVALLRGFCALFIQGSGDTLVQRLKLGTHFFTHSRHPTRGTGHYSPQRPPCQG